MVKEVVGNGFWVFIFGSEFKLNVFWFGVGVDVSCCGCLGWCGCGVDFCCGFVWIGGVDVDC